MNYSRKCPILELPNVLLNEDENLFSVQNSLMNQHHFAVGTTNSVLLLDDRMHKTSAPVSLIKLTPVVSLHIGTYLGDDLETYDEVTTVILFECIGTKKLWVERSIRVCIAEIKRNCNYRSEPFGI